MNFVLTAPPTGGQQAIQAQEVDAISGTPLTPVQRLEPGSGQSLTCPMTQGRAWRVELVPASA